MPDTNDLDRRRSLLATGLVGALLPKTVPEGHVVRAWLDSWAGLGHVVEEMREVGYNVRLDRSPFQWWAEFRRDQVRPLAPRFGAAGDFKPWKAVQRSALETLRIRTGSHEGALAQAR